MNERDFSAGRAARAQGQAPFAAILGCAGSAGRAELAFDQAPGELFVVRVAGNFVTPMDWAVWSTALRCWAPR
jgi:carbonic anhydrase